MNDWSGLRAVRSYLELVRFSHTIFALPFAFLSATWAWRLSSREAGVMTYAFTWRAGLGVLLCMVAARSFAMAVNRLADRNYDAQNPRTMGRHLPSGRLPVGEVQIFAASCGAAFVGATLLFLPNVWPVLLSVPVLLVLAGYSYAKRWTVFVHFWLGTALGLAPICAWIAVRGQPLSLDLRDLIPAFLLGVGVLLWVAGFDVIYACQDTDIDRRLGLKSLPAWLGNDVALKVAAGCHALMLVPLLLIPWVAPQLQLSWLYGIGLLLVASLLWYEHSIVSAHDLQRINLAFFQANAVISLILLLAGGLDAW
jgi:4-hydroxybenzoate polyprenyltransferase